MSKYMFGQIVIGPPGSGKTTYCYEMKKLLKELDRKVIVVNIDPANNLEKGDGTIDLFELITLEDVMENLKLGPNGALIYCMEFLEKNLNWLDQKISLYPNHYFLFDCPGQVELYTHHQSIKNILNHLQKKLGMHLCVVQLIDSHYCSSAGKFIATILMALSAMLQLEMPQINVLSKIDLAQKYSDKLQFGIDFYTEVLNMNYFLESMNEDPFTKKYNKLNEAIISLIEDYSLVSFIPLNVKDKKNLLRVQKQADKANGYVFGAGEEKNVLSLLACAAGIDYEDETLRFLNNKNQTPENKINLSEDLLWEIN
ncbi:conserved hypothetical protein [Pediculus humanus corporis]|uniref:GPN-loop GTPase 2 n=1 Tax=Pediculus humanus subsp. corporis TaxID=121224 RepID=E0VQU8_PEDHC|nr:uncharacterized protein Phum_PHUM387380 [Pediculus humanus corporis]EEB15754.1 conserved hypothetical protein [Pediculus humanus corporis]